MIEEIKKLWSDGLSGSRIGALIGKTRNAVIGKVHRLNLTPREPAVRVAGRKPRKPVATKHKHPLPVVPFTPYRNLTMITHQRSVNNVAADPMKLAALMDLKPGQCRWPHGDPKHGDFGFCTRKGTHGRHKQYCREHHERSIRP